MTSAPSRGRVAAVERQRAAVVLDLTGRGAVEPRRLEEDDRIGIANGGEQQPVGLRRGRGDDDAQAGDVGEHRLRALGVVLRRVDPAAGRRAHDQRAGQPSSRAVAQPRGLVHELVDRRVDEAAELDLGDRAEALRGQPDRHARDRRPRRAACRAPARRRSASSSPSVARKTPPSTPTSSPRTRTAGSSAMARASAMLTASTIVSVGHRDQLSPSSCAPLRRELSRGLGEREVEHRARVGAAASRGTPRRPRRPVRRTRAGGPPRPPSSTRRGRRGSRAAAAIGSSAHRAVTSASSR